MKKLIYMAALVALSWSSWACECDPITKTTWITASAITDSAYVIETNFYTFAIGNASIGNAIDHHLVNSVGETKVPSDYFYSDVTEKERMFYANSENYSVQRKGETYRVMVWDLKGNAWDATRSRQTFKSLTEAKAYCHAMHTYYAERNNTWTTVWGKGAK